jgi:hypothetical protein
MKLSKVEWLIIIVNVAIGSLFVYILSASPIQEVEEVTFLTTEDMLLPIFVVAGIIVAFLILNWLGLKRRMKKLEVDSE